MRYRFGPILTPKHVPHNYLNFVSAGQGQSSVSVVLPCVSGNRHFSLRTWACVCASCVPGCVILMQRCQMPSAQCCPESRISKVSRILCDSMHPHVLCVLCGARNRQGRRERGPEPWHLEFRTWGLPRTSFRFGFNWASIASVKERRGLRSQLLVDGRGNHTKTNIYASGNIAYNQIDGCFRVWPHASVH